MEIPYTKRLDSEQVDPRNKGGGPGCSESRMGVKKPVRQMPYTVRGEPGRAELLENVMLSGLMKSNTERNKSSCDMPYANGSGPEQTRCRSNDDKPNITGSETSKNGPVRVNP